MRRNISFTLNGKPVELTVDDDRMQLWGLRYDLDSPARSSVVAKRCADPAR